MFQIIQMVVFKNLRNFKTKIIYPNTWPSLFLFVTTLFPFIDIIPICFVHREQEKTLQDHPSGFFLILGILQK